MLNLTLSMAIPLTYIIKRTSSEGSMCNTKYKCIFCLTESDDFNTVEHIVPESLGNTDDIIKNAVCDKCQNYLGKEIENFVLSKTPFAFWRTLYGIRTKKGKDPCFDMTLDKKESGSISNYHPFSDSGVIMHPGHLLNEFIVATDINNDTILKQINSGQRNKFYQVMTPKILVYIGRFLGKIALEYWYKYFNEDVFNSRFNELRQYVRYGTTNTMWPILHWDLPYNLREYIDVDDDGLQQCTLYRHGYGEIVQVKKLVFAFDIGSERFAIIMDEKYPDTKLLTYDMLSRLFEDVSCPHILYYSQLK